MPQEDSPPSAAPQLRSFDSQMPVYVAFCNSSSRTVRPFWVDFQGEPVPYPDMPSKLGRRMVSYLGHVWVFRQLGPDMRMTAENKDMFVVPPNDQDTTVVVHVRVPLFTLRERCLQVVRQLVKPEDYRKLEIPPVLHRDLEDHPTLTKELRRLAVQFWEQTKAENE